jgi:4a-hydroxytetrahydrobiopterin dehydratase
MKLSEEQLDAFLSVSEGWERIGEELVKTYQCPAFTAAISFVTRVAEAAERLKHHPFIEIDYKQVTLRLTTHDEGGLTELDLTAAREMDAAYTLNREL